MAVSAKELEVIRADIMIAGTAMQQKDNPIMVNMAAYHFAQAIEKSIKAIISEKSVEPPPQETMYAHNNIFCFRQSVFRLTSFRSICLLQIMHKRCQRSMDCGMATSVCQRQMRSF